jgi:hypothetical protein
MRRLTVSKTDEQLILPLKTLMRKRASTKRLSRVEKEDVMYRIKTSIFKLCENM